MCGISGVIYFNEKKVSKELLKSMTDSIVHRGPDGEGIWLNPGENIGLGHRRLSIIDLTLAASQPMHYADGRYTITYNGEIYNYVELRDNLTKKGYCFSTESDTEVILALYDEKKQNCLYELNGMFAFAIWDEKEKKLFCARDRFGVKPFFYCFQPDNYFFFASETIAFKKLENFPRTIDAENLNHALQNIYELESTGKTIFKNIFHLLPAHYLEIVNKKIQTFRWWDLADNLVTIPSDYTQQTEKFRELFFDACTIRLRSDTSVAFALSGGMDSSSVLCSLSATKRKIKNCQKVSSDWFNSFSAVFPGTEQDETSHIKEIINHTGVGANWIYPDFSNLTKEIVSSTKLFDNIIFTPIISISPLYKKMKESGIKVSLEGHGGDELLFGYPMHVYEAFWNAIKNRNNNLANEYAKILCSINEKYSYSDLKKHFSNEKNFQLLLKKIISKLFPKVQKKQKDELKNIFLHPISFKTPDIYPNPFKDENKFLFDDFHYYSLPSNLRDFDRASMQHGVEVRAPFLDYRLVQYAFSLPVASKLNNGFTKKILRDSMQGIVPDNIRLLKKKTGISAPLVNWFNEPLKNWLLDTTNSASFIQSSYWNGQIARKYVEKQFQQNSWKKSNTQYIWALLNAYILIYE